MKLKLIICGLAVGTLSLAVHSCSKDYMEQYEANLELNSNMSRSMVADSSITFIGDIEQLTTGESEVTTSRIVDVYTIKGPGYVNAGVKAKVTYVIGGAIKSIYTYGVCSYGSCAWVKNLVDYYKVTESSTSYRFILKVSGTLSFSDDLASMLGKPEQYVNVEDIYFDTKL